MIKKITFLFLILFSTSALAWQPCMIFCDAGCGGQALGRLGGDVSLAMSQQTAQVQSLLQAINETTQEAINLGVDLGESWTTSTSDILSALDARTNKIELALIQNVKANEFGTDATVRSLVQTLKEKIIAENVSNNNTTLSDLAMPESGEVGVMSTQAIKESYLKAPLLAQEITDNQSIYANELKGGDESIAVTKKLSVSEETYRVINLISDHTLSDDKLTDIQRLFTMLSNPSPLPTLNEGDLLSISAQEYDLNRRIHNAKLAMINGIINRVIAEKAQLSDASWIRSFVERTSTEPGMSLSENLASKVNGRIDSNGWYLNIKLINDVGLNRELTYLSAEENVLLMRLTKRYEWRNKLYAMLLVEKSSLIKERLNNSL